MNGKIHSILLRTSPAFGSVQYNKYVCRGAAGSLRNFHEDTVTIYLFCFQYLLNFYFIFRHEYQPAKDDSWLNPASLLTDSYVYQEKLKILELTQY